MTTLETPGSKRSLKAVDIWKLFAGTPALSGVSLTVHPGEVVGLVGHNGAGKSTLLKVLSGAYRNDDGYLEVDGEKVTFASPSDALSHGVATVYQELSLLPNLSVTENTFLGREVRKGPNLDRSAMRKSARSLMEKYGIDVDVDRKVGSYPVATRQLMEIAIATTRNTRYLLLDEPTTSLEGDQVESFLEWVRDLSKKEGIGIVLVNHKLDELYAVADKIVALVDGKVRISGSADEVSHAEVVTAIAGEVNAGTDVSVETSATVRERQGKVPEGVPALSVRNLRSAAHKGVSFDVYPGRVHGFYGLIGSGRTEAMRCIYGADEYESGEFTVNGDPYKPKNPKSAQKAGFSYLTEERKLDGIVPQLNSYRNATLPITDRYSKPGFLDRRKARKASKQQFDALKVRGNVEASIESLSGGNQQKVLLARVIMEDSQILMLDEPTKGVDIGVKAEIHRIVRELAHEEGLAVMVVSSEEEEILELCDDVTVFAHGRVVQSGVPAGDLNVTRLREMAWQEISE